jgi:hypothetical protein
MPKTHSAPIARKTNTFLKLAVLSRYVENISEPMIPYTMKHTAKIAPADYGNPNGTVK